jgi:menaquinone-9 beta-reductase
VPWVEVYVGRGYELYVTPLPERELLVAGLAEAGELRDGAPDAFARWLAAQPALSARLVGAEPLTPLQGRAPLSARARAGWLPGCVLLGDAAGYVDPITGGGMTQAMLAAELLAVYAPRLVAGDQAVFAEFDRARRRMLRDYRLLTGLVLGLARHPSLAAAAIRLLGAAPRLFQHLVGVAGGTRRLVPAPA